MRYTRQIVVEGGYAPPPIKFELLKETYDVQSPLIIVITGANTGIGKATVQQLSAILSSSELNASCHSKAIILLLCRSRQKGQEAIDDIRKQESKLSPPLIQQCQMQVIPCDLCSFASIRKAVQDIVDVASAACEIADIMQTESRKSASPPIIHSLINNAGVMLPDLSYTDDKHESCLQANFLGHFLLTSLLLPYISTSVLNITSSTYHLTNTTTSVFNQYLLNDHIQCRSPVYRSYTLFGQYALTKWFNILHTLYLAKMYPKIFSAAIHPGIVRTEVVRNMPWYLRPDGISSLILSTLQKTPAQGAWNTIYVWAAANEWHGEKNNPSSTISEDAFTQFNGQYWVNRRRQPLVKTSHYIGHIPYSRQAEMLWDWAMEQVRLTPSEIQLIMKLQTQSKTNGSCSM